MAITVARCCGFEIAQLNPNPFSGVINTGGDDFAEAADCDANWYDFTGAATNWASSNTAVATVAHAYTNLMGVGSAFGSSDLILQSTAYHCPNKTFTPGHQVNSGPNATISMKFTGSKTVGDNLTFIKDSSNCSGSLGLLNCAAKGNWGTLTFTEEMRLDTDPVGKALAKIGDPAVPSVADALFHGDENARGRAALVLLNIRSAAVRKVLRQYVQSGSDRNVRELIRKSLG